jgi:hypothetical protein
MKKLIFTLFLFSFTGIIAQPNQEQYDTKIIHFGFSITANSASMRMDTRSDIMMRDSVKNVTVQGFPGIGLGGITNLHISDNFDLRLLFPVISFVQRDITYELQNEPNPKIIKVESAYADASLLLKFKSDRRRNVRAYVIGGGRISYDLGSTTKKDRSMQNPVVSLVQTTYGYEAGFGLDIYFPYFKFSPEIKVMNTTGDALHRDGFIFTDVLHRISPKMIVFSLHFE